MVFLIGIFLISAIIAILSINRFFLDSYKVVNLDFQVGEHLGFDPDPDALHFGTLPRGYVGFRDFEVQNLECKKCVVSIKSNLSWLKVQDNNFLLKKNEKKSVKVYLTVPENAEFGKYKNIVHIYLWKTI